MTPQDERKTFDQYVPIRMTTELRAKLERLAEKDRRTLSEYCRIVLEDHVRGLKKKRK